MKKTTIILALITAVSYMSLADAITYDTPKEIIERIQLESRHK